MLHAKGRTPLCSSLTCRRKLSNLEKALPHMVLSAMTQRQIFEPMGLWFCWKPLLRLKKGTEGWVVAWGGFETTCKKEKLRKVSSKFFGYLKSKQTLRFDGKFQLLEFDNFFRQNFSGANIVIKAVDILL